MANTKISALTADTAPTVDDLVPTVTDPAGTPANRKVTLSALYAAGRGVEYISVKDHGAVGDGATSDLVAFKAAVAAAIAADKPLYVPPGTYLLTFLDSTGNRYLDVTGDLRIFGAGRNQTVIKCGPETPTFIYYGFEVGTGVKFQLEDLELRGPADDGAAGDGNLATVGVHIQTNLTGVSSTVNITRVLISQEFFTGIQADSGGATAVGEVWCELRDVEINAAAQCVAFFGADAGRKTFHAFDCYFHDAGIASPETGAPYGHLVYIHPHLDFHFERCRFDNSVRWGLHVLSLIHI